VLLAKALLEPNIRQFILLPPDTTPSSVPATVSNVQEELPPAYSAHDNEGCPRPRGRLPRRPGNPPPKWRNDQNFRFHSGLGFVSPPGMGREGGGGVVTETGGGSGGVGDGEEGEIQRPTGR
jgi:hypothetical protein